MVQRSYLLDIVAFATLLILFRLREGAWHGDSNEEAVLTASIASIASQGFMTEGAA
jgi:hypothetical protein